MVEQSYALTIFIILLLLLLFTHRSRKRKQEEESDDNDFDGDDEEDNYASSDDEDRLSDAASSEGEDDLIDDEGDTRVIPSTRSMYQWRLREGEQTNSYQSVDGSKIIGNHHCYFTGGQYTNLTWNARGALSTGQKALVSKQRKRSIKLERVFGHSSNLSQVPYRKLEHFLLFAVSFIHLADCFLII